MIDHVNNVIDGQLFIYVAGLASMIWLFILKYNLHYHFLGRAKNLAGFLKLDKIKNASIQICVMCITFWITFFLFFVFDDTEMPARLTKAFVRGLILTPFVLTILKDQFINGAD